MLYLTILLICFQLPVNHWKLDNGLAIEGFDAVSYFNESGPLVGKESISYNYRGLKFQFYTRENLKTFKNNPDKYLPVYGGWCAYAIGVKGEKVKVDPETYKIIDGKLHLFYNFWGNNTLKNWNEDEKNLKQSADQYWENIIKS